MSKPKLKKSDITQQTIMAEAERLFSEKGVGGVSLRGIADAAGIKAGTILHHFPGGKDQLFNELVQSIFDQLMLLLAQLEQSSPERLKENSLKQPTSNLIESIVLLSSVVWDYFAANPMHARIIMREAIEEHSDAFELKAFQAKLIAKAAQSFLKEGIAAGEIIDLDTEAFILSTLSYTLVYHSAPVLRNMIIDRQTTNKDNNDKTRFLNNIRQTLANG